MDRTFAAQRFRLVAPWPVDLLRAASRILRRARLRRRLAVAAGLLAVVVAGWMALRDSPLVSVDHVQIRGVHGVEAANIQAALVQAAHRETTLHVRIAPLLAAVAPYHVVRDLRVSTSFPHGMSITVVERLPVAALVAGGTRTAVAGDGTLLGSELAGASVPQIDVAVLPSGRVADPHLLDQLTVLGAAPAPLARRLARVWTAAAGITVAMHNGLTILFGDATRPHAKWASAARVLADPTSSGATYIDVRMPERPAAGGLAAQALGAGGQVSATDPTAAALAASLGAAVSGSGAPAAPGTIALPGAAATTATGAAGTATGGAADAGATSAGVGGAGTGPSSGAATGTAGAATNLPTTDSTASPTASGASPGAATTGPPAAAGQQSTSTGG